MEGKGDYAPISKASIAGSGLDYLALGHIHQYSGLQREGDTYWAYPGCPEGRGFDEPGDKGVLWVEADAGEFTAEFSPCARRRYRGSGRRTSPGGGPLETGLFWPPALGRTCAA